MWYCILFFFKQKTADEMRISDWSSDVCSSDLHAIHHGSQRGLRVPGDFDLQRGGAVGAQPLRQPVRHGGDLGLFVVLAFVVVSGFAFAAETLPQAFQRAQRLGFRSEERRVGKEGVSTCSSRWSPYH